MISGRRQAQDPGLQWCNRLHTGEKVKHSDTLNFTRHRKSLVSLLLLIGCSALLSGCAVGQLSNIVGGGFLGGKKNTAESETTAVSKDSLLAAAKEGSDATGSGMAATTSISAETCPKFAVWPAEKRVTIYEIGRVGDNKAVLHRGEITKTARECSFANGRLTIKFGIAGRVLLGIKGKPGRISLPVNVFVTDGNRTKVLSDKFKISASVPAEKPYGYFSAVRHVTLQVPPGDPGREYKVYVAFDRTEPGAG